MDIEKYIIVQNQRIFIDISVSGCGSGCAYCYVPTKYEEQKLLGINQIESICEFVRSKYDCHGRIISLCPNTEPLKTTEAIGLILYITRFFISIGSYIQISTKEKLPKYFLEELNSIAEGRIYINVSIPYLVNNEIIEPNAASVEERIQNFLKVQQYSKLNMCLYIKPFSRCTVDIQQKYINIIKAYNIKRVCVGVEFDKKGKASCQSLYNKDQAKTLFEHQHLDMDNFIEEIRKHTNAKVYGSSVCCIHDDFNMCCPLSLFEYDEFVCKDCALRKC